MKMIVAMTLDHGIGKDNNLLCYLKSDLLFFKNKTLNSVVIMGRKTFESLPNGPLKNRTNLVLTRDKTYNKKGIEVFNNKKEILEYVDENFNNKDVYIIGGASIYKQFLEDIDTLYITYYLKKFEADTYFPTFEDKFKLIEVNKTHKDLIKKDQIKVPHVYTTFKKR
ncbi:MAG: dihydrofolate reductase [Bacillota bacterium]